MKTLRRYYYMIEVEATANNVMKNTCTRLAQLFQVLTDGALSIAAKLDGL